MRILKPEGIEIEFDDKKRHLLFSVEAIDIIQEQYDDCILNILNSLFEGKSKSAYGKLAFIVQTLLNEDVKNHNENSSGAAWDEITEKYVKRYLLSNDNYPIWRTAVIGSFTGSLPEDDDDPNQESGTTKK